MNRLTAILLLSIQLYTTGGYIALRQYLVHRSESFFNAQAAQNRYYEADVFEIRIPVRLGGIRDWADYEQVSGQIKFENNVYNYVQMRVTQQALYLKCIPNYKATRHVNQNVLNADPIKDVPVSKKEHIPDAGILLVTGLPVTFHCTLLPVAVTGYARVKAVAYHQPVVSRTIETLKQPPKCSV